MTVPPPTATERALQERQLELFELQLTTLQRLEATEIERAELIDPLFEKVVALIDRELTPDPEDTARAERREAITDELLELQLEAVRQGPRATPEQKEQIRLATEAAQATGEADIQRFSGLALEQLREELAPSLGLRPSDTPIVDRGGRVAAEGVRQAGQLATSLAGARAQAELNFPLAAAQVTGAQAGFQQNLLESIRQFQAQMSESATFNRLRFGQGLAAQSSQVGLGLSSGLGGNIGGTLANLQNLRLAQAPRTTTQSRSPGIFDFLQLGAGIAGAAIGAGKV